MTSLFAVLRGPLTVGLALGVAVASLGVADIPAQGLTGGAPIAYWGTFTGRDAPHNLQPVPVNVRGSLAQVGSSNSTGYALLTDGTLYAWGEGSNGQLGNGTRRNSLYIAVRVRFPPRVRIAYIPTDVMPFDSALAVDTRGHVWGWGLNEAGELCLGNHKMHTTPVELPLSNVTTLAGAGEHATYDSDGILYSCGRNSYGELGDGTTRSSTVPVPVRGLSGARVSNLLASWANTGALLTNGRYYDWGFDQSGQLGDGAVDRSSDRPVEVFLPGRVMQAALGGSWSSNGQTLVMLSDGALYAWGNDRHCQLGDGSTADEPYPVPVSSPAGVTYDSLAAGGVTSYAISTTGAVYAWGGNHVGQVGDGTTVAARKPVEVATGAAFISATANDVIVGSSPDQPPASPA